MFFTASFNNIWKDVFLLKIFFGVDLKSCRQSRRKLFSDITKKRLFEFRIFSEKSKKKKKNVFQKFSEKKAKNFFDHAAVPLKCFFRNFFFFAFFRTRFQKKKFFLNEADFFSNTPDVLSFRLPKILRVLLGGFFFFLGTIFFKNWKNI